MGRSARRKQEERQKGRVSPNHHFLRRRHKKWIVRTLLVLVVVGAIAAWHWNGNLWGYKQAPSFTLQASTGQLVSLRDYQGKQEVVVIFYMGAG